MSLLLLLLGSAGGGTPAPTYATWNDTDTGGGILLSGDLLTAWRDAGSTHRSIRATIAVSAGKWFFWNQLIGTANTTVIGVANGSANLASFLGSDANAFGYYAANGNKIHNGALTAYGASVPAGDYIGMGIDADARTIEGFILSGGVWVSQGLIDVSAVAGALYPAMSMYAGNPLYPPTASGDVTQSNFGQSAGPAATPAGYQTGVF